MVVDKNGDILVWAKICLGCDGHFETIYNNQKYCSKCKDEKVNRAFLKLRFDVLKRDNFTCQYCGRTPQDNVKLQIDHIDSKSKGGVNSIDNLITACSDCNIGKSDCCLSEHSFVKTIKSKR
jgi:hypothetical protein